MKENITVSSRPVLCMWLGMSQPLAGDTPSLLAATVTISIKQESLAGFFEMKKCNLDWENGSPTQKAVPSDPHSYALTAVGHRLG